MLDDSIVDNGLREKLKRSKVELQNGVHFILLGLVFGIISISGVSKIEVNGTTEIIIMVIIILFMALPVVFFVGVGCSYIRWYKKNGQEIQNIINKYGEEKIIEYIKHATVLKYRDPVIKGKDVYFTDKFVLATGYRIFDYQEIDLMYKFDFTNQPSKYGAKPLVKTGIIIWLLNGDTIRICSNPTEKQIAKIVKVCRYYNPKILYGDSKRNVEKNKYHLEQYKLGNIVIPDMCLELDTANPKKEIPDWDSIIVEPLKLQEEKMESQSVREIKKWSPTEERKYSSGKNLKNLGFFLSVFFLILAYVIVSKDFSSTNLTYEIITDEKREELIEAGYREYKTDGNCWKKIERSVSYGWLVEERSIYIFKLMNEKDGYLGISSVYNLKYDLGKDLSGLHIFYKNEISRENLEIENLEIENNFYEVSVIRDIYIDSIYGIPTEEYLREKRIVKWILYGIFGILEIICFFMIVLGFDMMKKIKNNKKQGEE